MPISVNLFQASGKRLDSRGMRGRGGSASASEMAFQSAGKSARNDLGSMAQARWLRTKRKSRQALWGRPSVETAPSRSKGSPSGPRSGSDPAFTRTVTRPRPTPRGQRHVAKAPRRRVAPVRQHVVVLADREMAERLARARPFAPVSLRKSQRSDGRLTL